MMGLGKLEKPKGGHFDRMVGPGAWPETEESEFSNRQAEILGIRQRLTGAKESWQTHQSYLDSEATWAGTSARAANARVEQHTKSMVAHEHQLEKVEKWCGEAIGLIGTVKEAIIGTVNSAVEAINEAAADADKNETDASSKIEKIKDLAYDFNKSIVQWGADTVQGKEDIPSEPPKLPKDIFKNVEPATGSQDGEIRDGQADVLFMNSSLGGDASDVRASVKPSRPVDTWEQDNVGLGEDASGVRPTPAIEPPVEQVEPVNSGLGGEQPDIRPAPPIPQPVLGRPPSAPAPTAGGPSGPGSAISPSAPTPVSSSGPPTGGGGGTSIAPSSPLSSGSSLGGSGAEQAADASAAALGQNPVGRAPVDPLQQFTQSF